MIRDGINCFHSKGCGLESAKKLLKSYFEENSHGLFYDHLETKKGRQYLEKILLFMRMIHYPWNCDISKLANDCNCIQMDHL